MFLSITRVLPAVLLASAMATFATNAQAAQATFTLPFEAHWGTAVLPAGDYTITEVSSRSWPKVLFVKGHDRSATILASIEQPLSGEEASALKIVNVGGTQVVREFISTAEGKCFRFEAPKYLRTQMAMRGATEAGTKIAVEKRN
ncbi:MAG: hypothetical protein JO091_07410 [Acidobacteriaceae bacterium]|nr:hypothetical protein [Acidobacteriaceae bacterium]